MAEIFPDEGIDAILTIWPKNGTNVGTVWMGLFTSQTSTTCPANSAVLLTSTGVTEATGTSYARQPITSGSWAGDAAGNPNGRATTAGTVTLATVGSGAWGTVNGFFLATAVSGGTAYCYSNFSDTTAIVTAQNDVIKVVPTVNFGA